jgi:GntR family transcriptional regulator, rspAB operon transcriptional repressor
MTVPPGRGAHKPLATILPPLDRGSHGGKATDHAYDEVRRAIVRREIPPGTVLAEGELADALGISRTPVRSVLRLLLQEELVEIGPRRQIVVRDVSPERSAEVTLLREALEPLAAFQAAETMQIDEVDQLRVLIMGQRRAAQSGDLQGFLELDERLHFGIASGAGLSMLRKFLGELRALVRIIGVDALAQEGRMINVIAEHEAIVDAIEARSGDAAAEAMLTHLRKTAAAVVASADASPRKA